MGRQSPVSLSIIATVAMLSRDATAGGLDRRPGMKAAIPSGKRYRYDKRRPGAGRVMKHLDRSLPRRAGDLPERPRGHGVQYAHLRLHASRKICGFALEAQYQCIAAAIGQDVPEVGALHRHAAD
jgi:hypothetical protein